MKIFIPLIFLLLSACSSQAETNPTEGSRIVWDQNDPAQVKLMNMEVQCPQGGALSFYKFLLILANNPLGMKVHPEYRFSSPYEGAAPGTVRIDEKDLAKDKDGKWNLLNHSAHFVLVSEFGATTTKTITIQGGSLKRGFVPTPEGPIVDMTTHTRSACGVPAMVRSYYTEEEANKLLSTPLPSTYHRPSGPENPSHESHSPT